MEWKLLNIFKKMYQECQLFVCSKGGGGGGGEEGGRIGGLLYHSFYVTLVMFQSENKI